jgi:PAS domain S-box-containing protein
MPQEFEATGDDWWWRTLLAVSGTSAVYLSAMADAAQSATPDTQLFRDVFNASPIGIAVENLEGQPLFVNPAFCSFLGFSEEELHNKHCVDFSPREDAEKDWALFQQLRAGSIDHYQLEKRYFRRDGSLVWGSLSISLLKSTPAPLVLAMVEDITDKKKAEEARFRHAAVIESSDDAIASGTLDGIIVSWNTGAQKIYGYTEAEAVGKPISMLVPPELPDEENKILEILKSGDRIEHFETVRVTKTGKRINVSLTISPIKDSTGRAVGLSGIARNITERKLAEEARLEVNRTLEAQAALLQSREGLLKIFVKHVPVAVAMLDRDMRYLQVSDRWCADYSLDSSQILGRSHYELFPDLPERWKQTHRRGLAGETLRAEEDRWDRESGTTWLRWEIRPWQNHDGVQGGILIFSEDITQSKHAQEALLGMNRKLLEAQEKERSRIGRELHDDIGQRLALLAIQLQQLREDTLTLRDVRSRVGEFEKQISEIATDIQSLSHELHSAKLQYLGIAGAMRGFCQEFADQQKMGIDFKVDDLPRPLSPDISLCLFRVLQEALHNSAKHSGGRHFEVRLWGTSEEIHLTVKDSGAGFDREAAKESRGLGLISMEERLKLVKGTLSIDSQPKRGTTIRARVPLGSPDDCMRAAG